ncbi:MAG: hypothetical protein MUF87_13120 [Anaerolineae bacterium]|jgi:type VI protein secretion system component VasK|nr:hypothetical protein [Anaerolineae bacterium]
MNVEDEKSKNPDLLTTLQHIERFHQRRTVFLVHAVISTAFQLAVWVNWFASYAQHGRGFEGNFFADRAVISGVLALFLMAHLLWARWANRKDEWILMAIQRQFGVSDFESEITAVETESESEVSASKERLKLRF